MARITEETREDHAVPPSTERQHTGFNAELSQNFHTISVQQFNTFITLTVQQLSIQSSSISSDKLNLISLAKQMTESATPKKWRSLCHMRQYDNTLCKIVWLLQPKKNSRNWIQLTSSKVIYVILLRGLLQVSHVAVTGFRVQSLKNSQFQKRNYRLSCRSCSMSCLPERAGMPQVVCSIISDYYYFIIYFINLT